MHELEGVRGWLARLQTMMQLILNAQNLMDELSVQKHYALAEDNKRLWARLDTQFKQAQKTLNQLMHDLTTWTGCVTIHEATEMTTDIRVRITQAYAAYESWREVLAMIQTVEALGGFESETLTRAEADNKNVKRREEYEASVAQVWRLVPFDSELLTL